jgi:hypothetical protein
MFCVNQTNNQSDLDFFKKYFRKNYPDLYLCFATIIMRLSNIIMRQSNNQSDLDFFKKYFRKKDLVDASRFVFMFCDNHHAIIEHHHAIIEHNHAIIEHHHATIKQSIRYGFL